MRRSPPDNAQPLSVAVIGSGFSGLGMAIRLKQAGIGPFAVFEAADEVGGTWRDNTYPGCACDVPSHLYSYSFEPNPRWSRSFGGQGEIFDYLRRCADKYGVRPHIRFRSEITAAVFDEAAGLWRLSTAAGETVSARVVVAGTGPLRRPSVPALPGLDRFAGATFHSSRWDHGVDLRGKRVAVIGTGASAVQFVPQIAPDVAQLHVFQRTPPWILPRPDRAFSAREQRVFERLPALERLYRSFLYWSLECRAVGFVVAPRLLRPIEWLARRHLRRSIPDPALRARLEPNYRIGCKRILISSDYYPALARPNVELVTSGITSVDERAITTQDGVRREVDVIVFGTGFDVGGFLAPLRVFGLGGQELRAAWQGGVEAYYGLAVSGFPNFFMLLGPNTGLGHNSMVFMIEAQASYVLQCIRTLEERRLRYLDVLPAQQREFNDRLQGRMKHAVWQTGCKSWYLDERGKNFTLWPGFTVEYWLRTRRLNARDFRFVQAG